MKYLVCKKYYDEHLNLLEFKELKTFDDLTDAEQYADSLEADGSAPNQETHIEERDDNDEFVDLVYERELR